MATWKSVLFPMLGLAAFFLYLLVFGVDIPTIIQTVREVNLPVYLLAVATVILETFVFALSWRPLLSFLSVKLSVTKCFLYVWFGIFVDILIPAESVSGELSRVYLVTREQKGTGGQVAASLVAHRLMGMGINVLSLLLGVFALLAAGSTGFVLNLSLFIMVLTIVFLELLIVLCLREKWTLQLIGGAVRFAEYVGRGRWKLTKLRQDLIKAAGIFHSSMKKFAHAPEPLLKSLSLNLLSWILGLAVAYLVFLSIGYSVHWGIIVVTWSIMTALKAIPLGVPFEAGLPEITMATLYILLGVPVSVSATATILNRVLTLWLRFFIGFGVQQWLGIKTIKEVRTKWA